MYFLTLVLTQNSRGARANPKRGKEGLRSIQGVPSITYKTYRGDREGRDEQKLYRRGWSKMRPWGVIGAKPCHLIRV